MDSSRKLIIFFYWEPLTRHNNNPHVCTSTHDDVHTYQGVGHLRRNLLYKFLISSVFGRQGAQKDHLVRWRKTEIKMTQSSRFILQKETFVRAMKSEYSTSPEINRFWSGKEFLHDGHYIERIIGRMQNRSNNLLPSNLEACVRRPVPEALHVLGVSSSSVVTVTDRCVSDVIENSRISDQCNSSSHEWTGYRTLHQNSAGGGCGTRRRMFCTWRFFPSNTGHRLLPYKKLITTSAITPRQNRCISTSY